MKVMQLRYQKRFSAGPMLMKVSLCRYLDLQFILSVLKVFSMV